MLWWLLMVVIVLGGIALIVYSRNEKLNPSAAAAVPPTKTDNWHAAFALDICGTLRPNLPANANLTTVGIRTFGDGLIDIDPGAATNPGAFTGDHATLGTFVSYYGGGFAIGPSSLTLPAPSTTTTAPTTTAPTTTAPTTTAPTTTTLPAVSGAKGKGLRAGEAASSPSTSTSTASPTTTTAPAPKGKTYTNGEACPTTSATPGPGRLQAKVWASPNAEGHVVTNDLDALKLTNGEMITVAFVPAGSAVPEPPSRPTLVQNLGGGASGTK